MSAHDILMSKLIQVQKFMREYIEEYHPEAGAETLHLIDHAILLVNDMSYEETKRVANA